VRPPCISRTRSLKDVASERNAGTCCARLVSSIAGLRSEAQLWYAFGESVCELLHRLEATSSSCAGRAGEVLELLVASLASGVACKDDHAGSFAVPSFRGLLALGEDGAKGA
jgi:hypothetical protein